MMGAWAIFVFFLLRPASGRPYGTIIREVGLLRQIVAAEEDFQTLEKSGKAHTTASGEKTEKETKPRKRFAKG